MTYFMAATQFSNGPALTHWTLAVAYLMYLLTNEYNIEFKQSYFNSILYSLINRQ